MLHNNNDDAAGALVIEPAVKGVIVPIVGCVALGFRDRFIGLQRVINNMEPTDGVFTWTIPPNIPAAHFQNHRVPPTRPATLWNLLSSIRSIFIFPH
jgi:hypothetical protein